MNTRLALPIPGLLTALLLAAGPAAAQTKPERGKIDGVEREARRASRGGDDAGSDCCSDGDGETAEFTVRVIGAALHALFAPSALPGLGYTRYPYAEPANPDVFAMRGMATGRWYGTVTGMYFDDRTVGGTLQAGHLALEGANGPVATAAEYTLYREPTRSDTDWLHLARVAVGATSRLGTRGLSRVMIGARLLVLDNGASALGPELELGVQAFPVRPWGVSVTARGALLQWNRGILWQAGGASPFLDVIATGSYFLGPMEVMAGWRFTKIGGAAAFNGPTAGMRFWFSGSR